MEQVNDIIIDNTQGKINLFVKDATKYSQMHQFYMNTIDYIQIFADLYDDMQKKI